MRKGGRERVSGGGSEARQDGRARTRGVMTSKVWEGTSSQSSLEGGEGELAAERGSGEKTAGGRTSQKSAARSFSKEVCSVRPSPHNLQGGEKLTQLE